MPYFFPKEASPEQINRITNILIERETLFWPSADRKFQTPSENALKLSYVANKPNRRLNNEIQRYEIDPQLIPRSRRIDDVMATSLPPLRRKKCTPSVGLATPLASAASVPVVVSSLGVRMDFPERSSETIGLNAFIHHKMYTNKHPLQLDSISKFAENFQAILGINPYGTKKMFDSVSR